MEDRLLKQLEQWYKEARWQEIIDALENLKSHDYDTIGCLAGAYNNRAEDGDFDRAIQLLNMVADFGAKDPLWHFRMGYAFFYSNRFKEAAEAFENALMLDPEDEEASDLLRLCDDALGRLVEGAGTEFAPEVYEEEDAVCIENFIADTFGEFDSVYHEIVSPDIHLDICIIPPDEERAFYTLVTLGMGAHRMNVPEELSAYHLERAELAVCLPEDWNIHSDAEKWYWPMRLLKVLARFPLQEHTWLGWGHTIDNGEVFDESTELCGCMLINPAAFDTDEFICPLGDGSEVNFYQIIPLYREEMEFKMEHSAEALLDQLNDSVLIVDPKRHKFCAEKLLS